MAEPNPHNFPSTMESPPPASSLSTSGAQTPGRDSANQPRGKSPSGTYYLLPTIPGYEVLSVLGRGGMGVVFKARQVNLNRIVALKMIRDSVLAGPEQMARFRLEAEAVAALQHPNIVRIYHFDEHEGLPFFTMEFVEAGNLAEKIAGQPQPPLEAAHLVEILARAMHDAHQNHIVHRDLKPLNVLLKANGTPMITDFGLAKRLDDDLGSHGGLKGTASYMAPEQAANQPRDIGPAVDIYALGAILYEMLTGRPPHLGNTVVETLDLVRFHHPVPPSRHQANLPPDLETICLKCLEKDPTRRYLSALELADDLRAFQEGRSIQGQHTKVAVQEERLQRMLGVKSVLDSSPAARDSWAAGAGFQLLDQVSRGDRVITYQARHLATDKLVYLKVLLPGSEPERLADLQTEADALARLQHPHIPRFEQLACHESHHLLAFEYVEGMPLSRHLTGKRIRVAEAVELVGTLARTLHFAHANGIVHRDLRPIHVVLAAQGPLKILHFGLVRRPDDWNNLTSSQMLTMLRYLAPEQTASEDNESTPATNIYTLGTILYELLTGRQPFPMTSFWGGLEQLLKQAPLPPSALDPAVPQALDAICLRCLEKEPEKRYPHAEALAEDLQHIHTARRSG